MSTNYNWLGPSWYEPWDVFYNDWLSEHSAIEFVSNCPVWRSVHFLQVKFFNTGFIWGDGGTLYANFAFLDCISRVEGHLVVSFVSVFHS